MKFGIDEFDFEFCKEIHEQLAFVDSILKEIYESPVSENNGFEHDPDSAATNYLRFQVTPKSSKCMPLHIHLMKDGLRMDLFHHSEAAEWNIEQIRSRRKEVGELIVSLFTSYVLYEKSESIVGGSRLILFDKNGQFVKVLLITGIEYLSFISDYSRELFFPIFSEQVSRA